MLVGIIWRKPVLTHASIVCEGMLASVNSVNSVHVVICTVRVQLAQTCDGSPLFAICETLSQDLMLPISHNVASYRQTNAIIIEELQLCRTVDNFNKLAFSEKTGIKISFAFSPCSQIS